jgi:multicomponent Na+:H+ antiporter subunit G
MEKINPIDILSYGLMVTGVIFWLWGTLPLISKRSLLFKLHSLSIADTLGSIIIIFALLLKIPSEWSLLLLAIITLAIWNTVYSLSRIVVSNLSLG